MRTSESKKSSSRVSGLAAGLLGGVVFVLVFLIFKGAVLPSVLAAAAVFAGSLLLFSPRQKTVPINVDGVTPEMFRKNLAEGRDKVRDLEEYIRRVGPGPVRDQLSGIRDAAVKILDEIERDPADIKTARQFLFYYLSATITVVKKYLDLGGRDARSPEVDETLGKVENSLGLIRTAFDRQHARLLQNDVLDLDAEIDVLKKSIEMDGFGEEAKKRE